MDFTDTREEAAFRAEARAFLAANAEPKSGTFETWQSRFGDAGLQHAKDFQRKKAEAGFAALAWPVDWGGRGLSPIYQVIYAQEETRYLVPRGYFEIGLGHVHADPVHVRHRGGQAPLRAARPCEATRCGVSSSPSPGPARTWPGCARARCATATTG